MASLSLNEFLQAEKSPKYIKIDFSTNEPVVLSYEKGTKFLELLNEAEIYLYRWRNENKKGQDIIVPMQDNLFQIEVLSTAEYGAAKSANLLLPDE